MGYQHANLVRIHWGHLPGNAYKALTEMAWSARDADGVPRYWGGQGRIAKALARVDDETEELSPTVRRVVVEVIRQLIEAGAIERARSSGPGTRAEYVLLLYPRTGAENPLMSDATDGGPGGATGAENPREQERKTRATGAENTSNRSGFSASQGTTGSTGDERKTKPSKSLPHLPKSIMNGRTAAAITEAMASGTRKRAAAASHPNTTREAS